LASRAGGAAGAGCSRHSGQLRYRAPPFPPLPPPHPPNKSLLPPRRRCGFARPVGNPQKWPLKSTGVAKWLSRRRTRRVPRLHTAICPCCWGTTTRKAVRGRDEQFGCARTHSQSTPNILVTCQGSHAGNSSLYRPHERDPWECPGQSHVTRSRATGFLPVGGRPEVHSHCICSACARTVPVPLRTHAWRPFTQPTASVGVRAHPPGATATRQERGRGWREVAPNRGVWCG